MTTVEYIHLMIERIKKFDLPITYDFDVWCRSYLDIKDELKYELCRDLGKDDLPEIKNDALIKVMNHLYVESLATNETIKWDRTYVREKYEKKLFDCDVLYYPAKNPKRLVINFSSMGKDRYDRYSRYWDPTEKWGSDTAYLFFKDDQYTYYLGNDDKPLSGEYFKIIKRFISMNSLSTNQVFTVGGSMGGYAALYYALSLELNGVIIVAPQTTYRAAQAHAYRNWEKHILNIRQQWTDLDMMIARYNKIPNIYIEYGHYRSDVLAVEAILFEISQKREYLQIIRKANWREHTVDTCLSSDTIESVIYFFENHGFIFSE